MTTEVFPNVYQIVVPLPKNQLKAVNCYVIKTPGRHLVIDTGMNVPECREALEAGLDELGLDLAGADFFITHLHADHMGLVPSIASADATVYFNDIEAEMMRKSQEAGGFAEVMGRFAKFAGFSEEELRESFSKHPGLRHHGRDHVDLTNLSDGDRLEIGEFDFQCVQTPGHSPGHMCLFDREKKFMICGDHVLEEISPNIGAWAEDDNPLNDYLNSLDRVYDLEVDLALPGHRRVIHDFRGRIDELRSHHESRLDEVQELLSGTTLNAYDVAARMTWDIKFDRWEDLPVMQKWFATGEAISHLRHLLANGHIKSKQEGEHTFFWRD